MDKESFMLHWNHYSPGVISTMNRKQCIEEQIAYHAAKLEQLGAELAAINVAEGVL